MKLESLNEVMKNLCDDSGFDMETAEFVIETFLNQTNDIVISAFELINSNRTDAFHRLEGLMHKLKGSSGNVRAKYIMHLAIRAEESANKENKHEIQSIINEIHEIISAYQVQIKKE